MAPPPLKFKPKPAGAVRASKETREKRDLEELERKRKREEELELEQEERRKKEKIPFGAVKSGQEDIFSRGMRKVGGFGGPRPSGPATGALCESGQAKRQKMGTVVGSGMKDVLKDSLSDQVAAQSKDQPPIVEHDSAYYLIAFFRDCPPQHKVMLRGFFKDGKA